MSSRPPRSQRPEQLCTISIRGSQPRRLPPKKYCSSPRMREHARHGDTSMIPALLSGLGALASVSTQPPPDAALTLHLRYQKKTGDAEFRAANEIAHWDARKTAIIICDMWDKHWCEGATRRVAELAPVMNEVVAAARKRGVFIIHAPS